MALKTLEIIKKKAIAPIVISMVFYIPLLTVKAMSNIGSVEKEVHVEHDFQLYQRDERF